MGDYDNSGPYRRGGRHKNRDYRPRPPARDELPEMDLELPLEENYEPRRPANVERERYVPEWARSSFGSRTEQAGPSAPKAAPQTPEPPASGRVLPRSVRNMFLGNTAEVTIVIRTDNGDEWLEELLASIDRQVSPYQTELLAVDTDSRDRTPLILRSRGIRTLNAALGQPYRDKALAVAEGQAVVFIDQDSLPLDEQWLHHMVRPLFDEPSLAVTQGQVLPDAAVPPYQRGLINSRPHLSGSSKLIFRKASGVPGALELLSTNLGIHRTKLKALGLSADDDQNLLRELYGAGKARLYVPEGTVVMRSGRLQAYKITELTSEATTGGTLVTGLLTEGRALGCELFHLNVAGDLPSGERGEAYAIAIALRSTRAANLLASRLGAIQSLSKVVAPLVTRWIR